MGRRKEKNYCPKVVMGKWGVGRSKTTAQKLKGGGVIFIEELKQELELVKKQCKLLETRIQSYPEGRLKISKSNGCKQFKRIVFSEKAGKRQEIYIKKDEKELALQLAQKSYDKKILRILMKRKTVLELTNNIYSKKSMKSVFEEMCDFRKELVSPLYLPDEEFIKRWEAVDYEHKSFAAGSTEHYSAKGERVRSKSEKIIADTLFRLGIPYRYEFPIVIKDAYNRSVIVHPDFTILNIRTRKEYYLEHLGMMDDPAYATNAIKKIELYQKNGIIQGKQLVLTFETKSTPLNDKNFEILINEFFL